MNRSRAIERLAATLLLGALVVGAGILCLSWNRIRAWHIVRNTQRFSEPGASLARREADLRRLRANGPDSLHELLTLLQEERRLVRDLPKGNDRESARAFIDSTFFCMNRICGDNPDEALARLYRHMGDRARASDVLVIAGAHERRPARIAPYVMPLLQELEENQAQGYLKEVPLLLPVLQKIAGRSLPRDLCVPVEDPFLPDLHDTVRRWKNDSTYRAGIMRFWENCCAEDVNR